MLLDITNLYLAYLICVLKLLNGSKLKSILQSKDVCNLSQLKPKQEGNSEGHKTRQIINHFFIL